MLKKILVGLVVVVALYFALPPAIIGVIGNFAIGWLVMDAVDYFMEEA